MAIDRWGNKVEIIIAQHHWPTWGNDNVLSLMKSQRDLYRYITADGKPGADPG